MRSVNFIARQYSWASTEKNGAGMIPEKYKTDGLHITIATVNNLDMLISMNFQHIVKRKTVKMTGHINVMNGYRAIEIYAPMEVIENEIL